MGLDRRKFICQFCEVNGTQCFLFWYSWATTICRDVLDLLCLLFRFLSISVSRPSVLQSSSKPSQKINTQRGFNISKWEPKRQHHWERLHQWTNDQKHPKNPRRATANFYLQLRDEIISVGRKKVVEQLLATAFSVGYWLQVLHIDYCMIKLCSTQGPSSSILGPESWQGSHSSGKPGK